jgi:hypothetical protein
VELGAITVFVVALAQLMRTAEAPRRLLADLEAPGRILGEGATRRLTPR